MSGAYALPLGIMDRITWIRWVYRGKLYTDLSSIVTDKQKAMSTLLIGREA